MRRCPFLDEGQSGRERFGGVDDKGCVKTLHLAFLPKIDCPLSLSPMLNFEWEGNGGFTFLRGRISNYGVEIKWLPSGGVSGVGEHLRTKYVIKSRVNDRARAGGEEEGGRGVSLEKCFTHFLGL